MKSASPARIPIPLGQRWRDARLRLVPVLVFLSVVSLIVVLWKDYVDAPSMIGQAEAVLSQVSSYKPGVLADLTVTRFQKVKAGDVIGHVTITDPEFLASSKAAVEAEIGLLRAESRPVVDQQRVSMDYDRLRMDLLRDRTQLAGARVNLELAGLESARMEQLFKDKIIAERTWEQARLNHDRLKAEVGDLEKLVSESEARLEAIQMTNTPVCIDTALGPLRDANLRQVEAEHAPVVLRAPVDGVVSTVFHRPGEAVVPGAPIVTISGEQPARIVGYLRPPILNEPQPGMRVQVRTRGFRRQSAMAEIMEVGSQFEPLPASIVGSNRIASLDVALPINVSMPPTFKVRPGELIDIVFTKLE